MVTIVTDVRLREGAEQKWDEGMRERMDAAKSQEGWVGGQLLQPDDQPSKRVIVGTWRSREDWQRWHEDSRFAETRESLDRLATMPAEHYWHEVVLDVRPAKAAGSTARKRHAKPPRET
jgi:heme-degrading monooxygenase HmoA